MKHSLFYWVKLVTVILIVTCCTIIYSDNTTRSEVINLSASKKAALVNQTGSSNAASKKAQSLDDKRKAEENEKIKAEQEQKLKEQEEDKEKTLMLNAIKNQLGANLNNVGLVYYDITTGETVSINENNTFNAASTIKVPLCMAIYDMAAAGKLDLNEQMQYLESDYEEGTGILQGMDKSKPIPINTLINYAITYSDNIATNMLIRRIGRSEMKEAFEAKLGHAVDRNNNTITAADAEKFLQLLYDNPNKNPYYGQLIDIMKNTVFHERIDKYIPENITAHKIGSYDTYISDIGIVYTSKPYILAVYTQGLGDKADEVIGEVSKVIYDMQMKK